MDASRFQQLSRCFEEARVLPPEEQSNYLTSLESSDPELGASLRTLLTAHAQPGHGFADARLALPPELLDTSATPPADELIPHPEQIDRYRVVRVLGEGGMGTVYLAEQTEPVQREVALKLIKPGMDSRSIVARFEAERQTLAMMEHPGIVKILDGGVTERGLPYFVMEYVKGEPITEYCDRLRLTVPQRVKLFIQVCEVVQHAHMKGVIHRDLKPSNILVEQHSGGSLPRIIDFGIARAMHASSDDPHRLTHAGTLIGTPAYMSPEQAAHREELIDTRSDVYSLGAILYELLTGDTPIDRNTLRTSSLADLQRMIREVDPIKPSSRIARLATPDADRYARHRGTERHALRRRVRGEFEWIVMKCLEKDRDRRYESAGQLAADLRHALAHEPVLAGPPSAWYRLRKFAVRNQVAVASAAVIALTLVITSAVSVRYAMREAEQRVLAEQREAQLSQILAFQTDMFDTLDIEAMGRTMHDRLEEKLRDSLAADELDEHHTALAVAAFDRMWRGVSPTDLAREVFDEHMLRRASASLEAQFLDQPLVEASLRHSLSIIYGNIGIYEPNAEHIRRAYELRRQTLGSRHPDTLRSLHHVGASLELTEQFAEAEATYRAAYLGLREAIGDRHIDTRHALTGIVRTLRIQQQYDEAEAEIHQAMTRIGATESLEDAADADLLSERARLAMHRGDLDAAERLMQRTYEIRSRVLGRERNHTLTALNDLGIIRMRLGRLEEAQRDLSEVVAQREALLGRLHPHTMIAMNNLAIVHRRLGRLDDAEASYRTLLDARRRVSGEDHSSTLALELNLGVLLQSQGRLDEAEPLVKRAYERRLAQSGPDSLETLAALSVMGGLKQLQGDPDEAEAAYLAVHAGRRTILGVHHRDTLAAFRNLFQFRLQQSRFASAEAQLHDHHDAMTAAFGSEHPHVRELAELAIRLYTLWHEAEPAHTHEEHRLTWQEKLAASGSIEP